MTIRRLILGALVAAVVASPALAGPREDVLGGISRCNAIPDDRAFLDCIYGAAQPLRAQLGLPPASAAQVRLVPMPVGRPAMGAGVAVGAAPAIAAAPPRPRGWFSSLTGGGAVLHIVSYSFDKHGMFTVTLSNGEVWQQAGNDVHYAHWHGAPPRDNVAVTDGAFGGATLQLDSENDPYFVKRLR